jgi:hypothetical protein
MYVGGGIKSRGGKGGEGEVGLMRTSLVAGRVRSVVSVTKVSIPIAAVVLVVKMVEMFSWRIVTSRKGISQAIDSKGCGSYTCNQELVKWFLDRFSGVHNRLTCINLHDSTCGGYLV